MKRIFFFALITLTILGTSCSSSENNGRTDNKDSTKTDNTVEVKENVSQAQQIKNVITASDMPTWDNGNDYFFFRADGTMGGGDASGKPSLYEGKWKMENDKFFWKKDTDKDWKQIDIKIEANDLLINGVRFKKITY